MEDAKDKEKLISMLSQSLRQTALFHKKVAESKDLILELNNENNSFYTIKTIEDNLLFVNLGLKNGNELKKILELYFNSQIQININAIELDVFHSLILHGKIFQEIPLLYFLNPTINKLAKKANEVIRLDERNHLLLSFSQFTNNFYNIEDGKVRQNFDIKVYLYHHNIDDRKKISSLTLSIDIDHKYLTEKGVSLLHANPDVTLYTELHVNNIKNNNDIRNIIEKYFDNSVYKFVSTIFAKTVRLYFKNLNDNVSYYINNSDRLYFLKLNKIKKGLFSMLDKTNIYSINCLLHTQKIDFDTFTLEVRKPTIVKESIYMDIRPNHVGIFIPLVYKIYINFKEGAIRNEIKDKNLKITIIDIQNQLRDHMWDILPVDEIYVDNTYNGIEISYKSYKPSRKINLLNYANSEGKVNWKEIQRKQKDFFYNILIPTYVKISHDSLRKLFGIEDKKAREFLSNMQSNNYINDLVKE